VIRLCLQAHTRLGEIEAILAGSTRVANQHQLVAQVARAFRGEDYDLPPLTGSVPVASVRVDHEGKMADFEHFAGKRLTRHKHIYYRRPLRMPTLRWLEKPGGSPREMVEHQRIRAILGIGRFLRHTFSRRRLGMRGFQGRGFLAGSN
jgi:hypothetical protein